MAERFASVSEEKLKFLIENKDSKNTRRTTKTSVKILNDYLREKNLEEPQDKKTPLACVLKKLYAEARKIDGSSYSKRSMTSLRFRINRHFKTKGTDIIKDPEFVEARCVDLKRQEDDEVFKGEILVMFEKGGPYCPCCPYTKHLSPKNEFLFQRPKKGSKVGVDDVCFDNMAVGEHTLAEKMKHISKEAELSRVYTNHSIRATPITALETCGCEARHIIADHDSGHKS
ncbi:unnamed protein product, partial [Pocillopora meandrina]